MGRSLAALLLLITACSHHETTPDARVDAGPADAAPRSSCVDSHTLEIQGQTIDCGTGLCATDPSDPTNFACVHDGDGCGALGGAGACAGTVYDGCDGTSGKLETTDCASVGAICGESGGRSGCVLPCPDLSTEGRCLGASIQRCVWANGAYGVETDPCPSGMVCSNEPDTLLPGCVPQNECSGLGPQGACAGTKLTTCDPSGNAKTTDCAATGEVCAFGGDAYACAPAGQAGARMVTGTIRFEKKTPIVYPDGTAALSPTILQRPARGASVAIVNDADGSVLAWGLTADDGTYALAYDAPDGTSVHVLAATTNPGTARPARVLRADGLVHGVASPSFPVAASSTEDLLATDASSESEAFNVFDDLVSGLDQVRALLGVSAPHPIRAVWERGASDGTYYDIHGSKALYLVGGPGDDDGYDDGPTLHEFGHFVEDFYGRFTSEGGYHVDYLPSSPTLAWSEGFATYWSSVVRGDPVYVDTNAALGWAYDLENTVTKASATQPLSQDLPEDTISQILWDVGDAPSPDDDPLSGPQSAVLAIETGFRSSFNDRNVVGVDLVDFLDGWLKANPATCAGLKTIVSLRDFPYDYPGCP